MRFEMQLMLPTYSTPLFDLKKLANTKVHLINTAYTPCVKGLYIKNMAQFIKNVFIYPKIMSLYDLLKKLA